MGTRAGALKAGAAALAQGSKGHDGIDGPGKSLFALHHSVLLLMGLNARTFTGIPFRDTLQVLASYILLRAGVLTQFSVLRLPQPVLAAVLEYIPGLTERDFQG